jgi:hypothetical protein
MTRVTQGSNRWKLAAVGLLTAVGVGVLNHSAAAVGGSTGYGTGFTGYGYGYGYGAKALQAASATVTPTTALAAFPAGALVIGAVIVDRRRARRGATS